ncbi:hypothetical protein, partial [Pseudoalteromonas sp. NZS127]|uniref:hypothetical protein n=1 Tax=Pseudoalteromonas sp. NZS127 TaxID=2792047 RepID=UPI001E514B5C
CENGRSSLGAFGFLLLALLAQGDLTSKRCGHGAQLFYSVFWQYNQLRFFGRPGLERTEHPHESLSHVRVDWCKSGSPIDPDEDCDLFDVHAAPPFSLETVSRAFVQRWPART